MRGKQAPKRDIKPDERYGDVLVSKFINYVMQDGKKDVARQNVYEALEYLGKQTKTDPVAAFHQAIEKVGPDIETRSKRVGGSNLQVPTPVNNHRKTILALRWIVDFSRKARKDKPFAFYLGQELTAAFNGEGASIKKREEVEHMAESNRAFAQFA